MLPNDPQKSLWIYTGAAAGALVLIVGTAAIIKLKPKTATTAYLQSDTFKADLASTVQRLSGIEVTLGSVTARDDLSFLIEGTKLRVPAAQAGQETTCEIPRIEGVVGASKLVSDIKSLTLNDAVCNVTVDRDFVPVGVGLRSFELTDLSLVFGARLDQVDLRSLDLKVTQQDGGNAREVFAVNDLDGRLNASWDVNGAKARVELKSSGLPVRLVANPVGNRPLDVDLGGRIVVDYDTTAPLRAEGQIEVRRQNLVPSLDTRRAPLRLSFTGRSDLMTTAELPTFAVEMDGMARVEGRALARLSLATPTFEFAGLKGTSERGLHSLLGLPTLPRALSEFSDGTAKVVVQRRPGEAVLQATAQIPQLAVRPSGAEEIAVKGIALKLDAHAPDPGDSVVVALETGVKEVVNPKSRVEIRDAAQTLKASITEAGRVEIQRYELNVAGNGKPDGLSHVTLAGVVDFGKEQLVANLRGEMAQSLAPFSFGDADVDGRVAGTVELTADAAGDVRIVGIAEADVQRIKVEQGWIEGLKARIPYDLTVGSGYTSNVLMAPTPDLILDEYFAGTKGLKASLELSAAKARITPDGKDPGSDFAIGDVKATVQYHYEPGKGLMVFGGNVAAASFAAAGTDGSRFSEFPHAASLDWAYDETGIVTANATITDRTGKLKPVEAKGIFRAEGRKLTVDYDVNGPVMHALATTARHELLTAPVDLSLHGQARFDTLINPINYQEWDVYPFNFPYDGDVSGEMSAQLTQYAFDVVQGTRGMWLGATQARLMHSGKAMAQDVRLDLRTPEARMALNDGSEFTFRNVETTATARVVLPLPADMPYEWTTSASSIKEGALPAPSGPFSMTAAGVVEKGATLRFDRLDASVGNDALLTARGSIGGFHPIENVTIDGSLAADFKKLSAALKQYTGPKREVLVPFRLRSEGKKLELSGDVATHDGGKSQSAPFSWSWEVDEEDGLKAIGNVQAQAH